MSPTARSLAVLRKEGWTAGVVERWNPGARVRQDFLGFADIVAVKLGTRALAIQACMVGDQSKRLAKIRAERRADVWLDAGNWIEVWGWGKKGARGKRKVWTLTRTNVERRYDPHEIADGLIEAMDPTGLVDALQECIEEEPDNRRWRAMLSRVRARGEARGPGA